MICHLPQQDLAPLLSCTVDPPSRWLDSLELQVIFNEGACDRLLYDLDFHGVPMKKETTSVAMVL